MTVIDPRTPCLIGVAQRTVRPPDGPCPEPLALWAETARAAAEDTRTGASQRVLDAAGSLQVVYCMSWPYDRPVDRLAERLGIDPPHRHYSGIGGTTPQVLVADAATRILEGTLELAVITGAEALDTRRRAKKASERLPWSHRVTEAAPFPFEAPFHPAEVAHQVFQAWLTFPVFDIARRARLGAAPRDYARAIGELLAPFSEVAATNPHAWIQEAFTAEEIRTPAADNRMIGFPYTKRMNSNNAVEQGAAVILCSVERATALGVPRDRWVFPHSGTAAHDHYFFTQRDDLGTSPAMRLAGRAALALAGVGLDDLAHVDLYSCFPSAVEIAAAELGLGTDRPLTVTGGLSFAGGPWNNYVMHALATMVGRLRDDPGARGLVTANGGHITKHAFGVYSTDPPADGFRYAEPQAEVDALPSRVLCEEPDGEMVIEAWTAMHDRNGARETGIVVGLLADGRRALGTTSDADELDLLVTEDLAGRTARINPDGSVELR